MQPKTKVCFEPKTLSRLLRTVGGLSRAAREPGYVAPIPLDIGIELTNSCNMRCKHCFLWNDKGLYRRGEAHRRKTELDWTVMDKILEESRPARSNLFFWGTEPLLYSHWDRIADRLVTDKRWTVICTNGTLVEQWIDSLLKISENLVIVLSIEGPREEHDSIRGAGAYDRLMKTIALLRDLKQNGKYHGLVTLHCVLHQGLVPKLYDFAVACEKLDINSLYVGFPWFINTDVAARMDETVAGQLGFLHARPGGKTWSWHTYLHHLSPECLPELRNQLRRIRERTWGIRFRFQPAIEDDELEDFILGTDRPAQGRTRCLAVSNRLDVRCTGKVTSCQCFPELEVGDLNHQGMLEVWHGSKYEGVRKILVRKGLLPVCSKCILLYLNGR